MTTRGGGVDDETNQPAAIAAFLQNVTRALAGGPAAAPADAGQANGGTLASTDALLDAQWTG